LNIWRDRDVLVTGHTGFKGAWLCLWLNRLGARIHGYALPTASGSQGELSLFDAAGVRDILTSHCEADLRDRDCLLRAWRDSGATALFHLAAQPLVREGYARPYETFEINTQGTVAVLDVVRAVGRPSAAVMVTTDKCYENFEAVWGRRETDPLGGSDPYSASKAAAEVVVASYRQSYFPAAGLKEHRIRVATARGGNVIGGGDWAADRLMPDLARAALSGRAAVVRNPSSVRPWQHVLDCVSGYIVLAERLLAEPDNPEWCSAWNFGAEPGDFWTVARLADAFCSAWGRQASWREESGFAAPPETGILSLCIDKAVRRLGWRPRWNTAQAVAATAAWYNASARPEFEAGAACIRDICDYMEMGTI
jgi:CDP-glucose 4,6-dehydratase